MIVDATPNEGCYHDLLLLWKYRGVVKQQSANMQLLQIKELPMIEETFFLKHRESETLLSLKQVAWLGLK